MEQNRVRLGELLVGAKIITPDQLQEVLSLQASDGRRLGALLVASGYVTETQVTQILSQQLSVPWVSLHHIDFSRQLLNLVQRELAERHCLIPIYVRRSRHQKETLYIAMDDPTDLEARAEVELYAGLPVRPMIAPPSDIRSAIRVYYGGEAPQGPPPRVAPLQSGEAGSEALAEGSGDAVAVEAAGVPDTSRVAEGVVPPTLSSLSSPSLEEPMASAHVAPPPSLEGVTEDLVESPGHFAPEASRKAEEPPKSSPVASREASMPAPRAADGPAKMVTLTLLDGTQLNLPAAPARLARPEAAADMMTARDLVVALRAHASGADASLVLGSEINWQRVCAALLSILLRKQLIADWEFVDELRR